MKPTSTPCKVRDLKKKSWHPCRRLLVAAWIVLMTAPVVQAQISSFPYREGFEGSGNGGFGSWTQSTNDDFDWSTNTGATGSGNTGPAGANEGNYYIYTETSFPVTSGDTAIIENDFDFSSIDTPELRFDYHMYFAGSSNGGTLNIDVSTNSGTSWTNVFTRSGDQGQQWINDERIAMPAYGQNSSVRIRFQFVVGSNTAFQNDCAIDDLIIQEKPDCYPVVNPGPTAVDTNSATVSWSAPTPAPSNGYEYQIVPAGNAPGTGVIQSGTTTSTSVTFTGLSPNTDYSVYVRSDCGSSKGTSIYSQAIDFTTECVAFSGSYSQNFDGATAPEIDQCWTVINNVGGATFVGTDNFQSNSAPNSVELYNFFSSNPSTDTFMVVSPQFSDLDTNKFIAFSTYDDDNTSDLIVGSMSNPNDATTFAPFDTLTAAEMDDDAWERFVLFLPSTIGNNQYIAFRHGVNDAFDNIYIDDFEYGDIGNPDVAVDRIYTRGRVRVGNSQRVQAIVSNVGRAVTNQDIYLETSGANAYRDTIQVTLNAANQATNTSATINFPPFSRSNIGVDTMRVFAAPDQNGANDTITVIQEVTAGTEAYIYPRQPLADGGIAFTGATGDFVAKFNTDTLDTLRQVLVDFDVAGADYRIGVWDQNTTTGGPGNLIYQGQVEQTVEGRAIIPIDSVVQVTDTFFVGPKQLTTTRIDFRFQFEDPPRLGAYWFTAPTGSNNWGDFGTVPSPFRFAVQVQFPTDAVPGCPQLLEPASNDSNITTAGLLRWQEDVLGGIPEGFLVYLSTNRDAVANDSASALIGDSIRRFNIPRGDIGLATEATHYWKVLAYNDKGRTINCDLDSFETGCFAPTSFTLRNVTNRIASLSWDSIAQTSVELLWGVTNFDTATSGILIDSIRNASFTLDSLQGETTYDVYIRTACASGPSEWIGPLTFTTECDPITQYPYLEDFESSNNAPNCFELSSVGGFDWEVDNGGTPSFATGPDVDHTLGTASGNYIYNEASGSGAGDSSFLQLQGADLSSLRRPELSFYYHMYGDDIVELEVQAFNRTTERWDSVFAIAGEQQQANLDPWCLAEVDVSAYKSDFTLLRFVGTVTGLGGDIALDDIGLDDACNLSAGVQPPSPVFSFPDTAYLNSPTLVSNRFSQVGPEDYFWFVNGAPESTERNLTYRPQDTIADTITLEYFNCFGRDTVSRVLDIDTPTRAPSVEFLASSLVLSVNEPVTLTELTEFGAADLKWRISPSNALNAISGSDSTAQYTFALDSVGQYDVTLTASNRRGSDSLTKQAYLRVLSETNMCIDNQVSAEEGIIYDEGGPDNPYQEGNSGNAQCQLLINPCADSIRLALEDFDLGAGDFLRIYDGSTDQAPPLHNPAQFPQGFTGKQGANSNLPDSVIATSGSMLLVFESNSDGLIGEGFRLRYTSTPAQFGPTTARIEAPDTVCIDEPFFVRSTSTGDNLSYTWYANVPANPQFSTVLYRVGANETEQLTITASDLADLGGAPSPGNPTVTNVSLVAGNCLNSDSVQQNIVVLAPTIPSNLGVEADKRFVNVDEVIQLEPSGNYCLDTYTWRISRDTIDTLVTYVSGDANSARPRIALRDTGVYDVSLRVEASGSADSVVERGYIRVTDYCDPTSTFLNNGVGINVVALADQRNVTTAGDQGYTDYTGQEEEAELARGGRYTLEVSQNNTGNRLSRIAWMDYDRDGRFDSSEVIGVDTNSQRQTVRFQFQVPATTTLGYTRLRVAAGFGVQVPLACGPVTYGEYEDYGVFITRDNEAPIISLNGSDTIRLELGRTLVDPGATATDRVDGDLTSAIQRSGSLGTTPGLYTLTYAVSDQAGNRATVSRTVILEEDVTAPEVRLNGGDTVLVGVGTGYQDPGATAVDSAAGALQPQVIGQLRLDSIGTYRLIYRAEDNFGNADSVIRVIQVVDTTAPSLRLEGASPDTVIVNTQYEDPGAVADDNYYESGDIMVMRVFYSVDTSTPGRYIIAYRAEDPSGNISPIVERQVDVIDTTTGVEVMQREAMQLAVYPNPTSGPLQLRIELPEVRELSVSIADVSGKQIRMVREAERMRSGRLRIETEGLSEGVYLLQVRIDGERVTRRFRVQR